MEWYGIIGLIAAIAIAIYMMPQLIKVIKTKDTSSISIIMLSLAVFGDLCFVINGSGILASNGDKRLSAGLPILLGNLFGLLISAATGFFKVRAMLWSKKYNIKEDQIPNHFKEIKSANAKARAEKKQAKLQQKESQEITDIKKDTKIKSDSGSIIG